MANGCTGAQPAVVVTLHGVTRTPYLNRYQINATVTNRGDQAQAGNTLQFLDVVYYGGRIDARGIPPLAPGQSYTVSYVWPRSVDAGLGTSPVDFRIRSISPLPANGCARSTGSAGITV
jgi:hypothetical protein